jgi:GxxExxY protein
MNAKQLPTDELSFKVIGICMDVHRELGPGFPEEYYQRALEYEFTQRHLPSQPQAPLAMFYKDFQVGVNYLDFDIDETLILEIKSVNQFTKTQLYQVLKYLSVAKRSVALLVNFGNQSLEYKRIFPAKKIQEFWKGQLNKSHTHHNPLNPNSPLWIVSV